MTSPMNVFSYGDSVFVSTYIGLFSIYEFTKDGEFVRHYETPSTIDAACVSLDGTKFYATAHWGTKLYTIDRATGSVTTKDFGSDAVKVPRGVADIGGGKVAMSSRGTCTFLVYDTLNDSYTTYGKDNFPGVWDSNPGATSGPMAMQFDEKTGRLWMYGAAMGLGYYDVGAGTYTVVSKENNRFMHGFAFWDGSVIFSIYATSSLYKVTPVPGARASSEPIALATLGLRLNRIAVIDMPQTDVGTNILIR